MENKILLKLPKKKIANLNKIIEGYDNLGLVTTINADEGLALIHVTPDTRAPILKILAELTFIEVLQD